MQAEARTLNHPKQAKSEDNRLFQKYIPHMELIAALLSGLLIVSGWLLARYDWQLTSTLVFVCAYLIGGFAKAKEGIEDTISSKQLNVEIGRASCRERA